MFSIPFLQIAAAIVLLGVAFALAALVFVWGMRLGAAATRDKARTADPAMQTLPDISEAETIVPASRVRGAEAVPDPAPEPFGTAAVGEAGANSVSA